MRYLDVQSIRIILRRECAAVGSQRAWAERHGVSDSYLTHVLKGCREPGEAILDALGYGRVMLYTKRPGKAAG